ncbi:hypothetical protein H5410_022687 [Solanum commersonii]|uniref:Uncharacterized protein n=1 Tax=Solanum commersonii TaxID=4109 RepID=A0A9J5ZJL4_SOLCO|nr:hypothetical protein H5410_022687 [Solanum commersonii]
MNNEIHFFLRTSNYPESSHMATEVELSKHGVSLSKISKYFVNWVTRVFVIRKGSVMSYKNSRHERTFHTIILVDGEHIDTWKDFLKTNKSYYIANGLLYRVNPNYTFVHKEIELSITNTQS